MKLISALITRFRRLRAATSPGSPNGKPGTNVTCVRYAACWTEDDGIFFCGHEHPTIAGSMNCLVPDGGCFILAFEAGRLGSMAFRSLNEGEFKEFLAVLKTKHLPVPVPPR